MDVILSYISQTLATIWNLHCTVGTLTVYPGRVVFVCAVASFAIGIVLSIVWGNRDAG